MKKKGHKEPHHGQKTESQQQKEASSAGDEKTAPAAPAEELKDRLLRLQADFDNFRKRTIRERNEWYRNANEDLMRELLPVIDHFELGLHTAEKLDTDPAVLDGLRLVHQQLLNVLEKFGLKPLDAENVPFDPRLHEAVTHVPSEEYPADMVIAQTRRGYMLGDKVLRAAQVVVSSGNPAGVEDTSSAGRGSDGEPAEEAPPNPDATAPREE